MTIKLNRANAFENCSKLKKISGLDTGKTIEAFAFSECDLADEEIRLPNIETVGEMQLPVQRQCIREVLVSSYIVHLL